LWCDSSNYDLVLFEVVASDVIAFPICFSVVRATFCWCWLTLLCCFASQSVLNSPLQLQSANLLGFVELEDGI
jgi:hypothetical protein